jgi:RNA polymerase sigma factor for flagellar operon FliA
MRDREAQIRSLFPMVRTIARRLASLVPGADAGDLVGDGSVGLIRAVDSFDPQRGVPLRAYARRIVLGAMLNGLRRMDPVSERVRRTMRYAEAVRMERAQALGRLPSQHELEEAVPGLARARTHAYRYAPLSLDGPFPADESCESARSLDPAEVAIGRARRREIARALSLLPKRERQLVYLHYWNGISLRAVSKRMMVSPQRASQLHLAALARMRKEMRHEWCS